MEPAYMPATRTPERNNLTPHKTFPLIGRLCAASYVVGCELLELILYRAPDYEITLNADRIIRTQLVGITLDKKGMKKPHHPDTWAMDGRRK